MPFDFDAFDNTLKDLVNNSLKTHDNNQESCELEIRFSEISKSDLFQQKVPAKSNVQPNNWAFRPVISANTFHRILSTFENYGLTKYEVNSVDTFYKVVPKSVSKGNNGRSPQPVILRHTLFTDPVSNKLVSQWMTKRKTKPIDIWCVNMRISLSTEEQLKRSAAPHNSPYMIRRKSRTSFTDWCCRYDFTQVDTETLSNDGDITRKDKTFEIEIEFLPSNITPNPSDPLDQSGNVINHIKECSKHMLRMIQESPSIITLAEKHNVLIEYSILSRCFDLPKARFVGAQPETLHRRHLPLVKRKDIYSITEKYDGERYLLFVSDNGYAYMIGRNMKTKCTGLINNSDKGSILDVEYVNGMLFAFDILFHKGVDLRGKTDYLLENRLELLSIVVDNFMQENGNNAFCIPLFAKEYIFSNFDSCINNFIEKSYEDGIKRDGFIYTPVKEYYPTKPKWSTLLKWKPPEMNSIDFHIKKSKDLTKGNTWDLYVGTSVQDKQQVLKLFDPHPNLTMTEEEIRNILKLNSDADISDLGIVECTWDFDNKQFVPLRIRKDKLLPNFITVAMDVWESLLNPVHISDLQLKSFVNMRKLHNIIKQYLVQKAVHQSKTASMIPSAVSTSWADDIDEMDEVSSNDQCEKLQILDLACGRGGDLWKWAFHCSPQGSLNYVGVDVDEELLMEARRRSRQVTKRYQDCNLQFTFHKCDLRKDTFSTDEGPFDIVSCQFALHYFYESMESFSNFMSKVKEHIRGKGIFIVTLFDGQQVYDLCLCNENIRESIGHGFKITPCFNLNEPLDKIKEKEFGIPIEAVLQGDEDVILKDSTREYLVFADIFVNRMAENGFTLLETLLFRDHMENNQEEHIRQTMTDIEKVYSSLHRYYIFTYDNPDAAKTTSPWKKVSDTIALQISTPTVAKKKGKSKQEESVAQKIDIYKRCCNEIPETKELCGDAMSCLSTTLANITGIKVQKNPINVEEAARFFQVNIGILQDDDECKKVIYNGSNNVDEKSKKILYFIEEGGKVGDDGNDGNGNIHYQLLARDENEIWFPLAEEKTTTKRGRKKASES